MTLATALDAASAAVEAVEEQASQGRDVAVCGRGGRGYDLVRCGDLGRCGCDHGLP